MNGQPYPSSDPNREKKKKKPGPRKPGGQNGHVGTTLRKFDTPDQIENIPVDRKKLPKGNDTQLPFPKGLIARYNMALM